MSNSELRLYNFSGTEVMRVTLNEQTTKVETNNLAAGIYFYKLVSNEQVVKSGKLVAAQ